MNFIGRLIVKLADLVEAEGRVLRREAIAVGLVLVVAFGALLTGLGGAAMLAVALFLGLSPHTGPPWAAAICGGLLLACTGVLAWWISTRLLD